MRRSVVCLLLAGAVLASSVMPVEAAGPGGSTAKRKKWPSPVTVTKTTTTNTAVLDIITTEPNSSAITGSVVYTKVTTTTTVFGRSFSTTRSALSGNIQRVPTVDNNEVRFDIFYGGIGSGFTTATVKLRNGSGSFNHSSVRGDVIPTILEGDVVQANASEGGQAVSLKVGIFGAPVESTTTH